MTHAIDALTSPALKHLREQWWDEAFTAFLEDTLEPTPGKRILDVGCGTGTAEIGLARLRMSQVQLFGVDLLVDRVRAALASTRGMNARAGFAAADACRLPFADGTFDATFCVAVLQHITEVNDALLEIARVTRPGGRVVAVEPDNGSRYWFSSAASGMEAFGVGRQFFLALAAARGEAADPAVGPRLPGLFGDHGIEPTRVEIFPVAVSHLGTPAESIWDARRAAISRMIESAPDTSLRRLGHDYLKAIEGYQTEAAAGGSAFVELQATMLFATVGQKQEA